MPVFKLRQLCMARGIPHTGTAEEMRAALAEGAKNNFLGVSFEENPNVSKRRGGGLVQTLKNPNRLSLYNLYNKTRLQTIAGAGCLNQRTPPLYLAPLGPGRGGRAARGRRARAQEGTAAATDGRTPVVVCR